MESPIELDVVVAGRFLGALQNEGLAVGDAAGAPATGMDGDVRVNGRVTDKHPPVMAAAGGLVWAAHCAMENRRGNDD